MSREAMKLALEALEYIEHNYMSLPAPAEKAITALREALAEQALDKMAENARELGLDYEPVCNKDPQGCWNVRCQLGKKCKNTPAQQEPVAWMYPDDYERMSTSETFCTVYSVEVGSATRGESTVALYTSPQPAQRKPLTEKEIREWWASENGLEDCEMCKLDDFVQVVRAIEAKLKEKNT